MIRRSVAEKPCEVAPEVGRQSLDDRFIRRLHSTALIALLTGAAGSFVFMLYVGRRNNSRLLMAVMAAWVLSPFIALAWASLISKRWPVLTRVTLYSVVLFLTVASLAVYGVDAWMPPRAQAAFAFVIVPPVSWLLISMIVGIAALIAGRTARRGV